MVGVEGWWGVAGGQLVFCFRGYLGSFCWVFWIYIYFFFIFFWGGVGWDTFLRGYVWVFFGFGVPFLVYLGHKLLTKFFLDVHSGIG